MKWLLLAILAVLVGTFVLWQRDSMKSAYVNGLTQYNKLPGREYIFERDCYVFKLNSRSTDYALIGAHATVPELPAVVDDKLVGTEQPGVRLLDTVRTGSRFKIASVRRDERRTGTEVTFEVLMVDEAERKYPRLDAFFILDHTPEKNGAPPLVREDYAVARVR